MTFRPSIELIQRAFEKGYAVPAFCVWDNATIETVLAMAAKCRAPVLLMGGPGEFPLTGAGQFAAIARILAGQYEVRAALHLDHGDSLEMVRECLDADFTSLMLDYSARPFSENAAALRRVVEWARPRGATVEGELGAIGRVDDATTEGGRGAGLTDPREAGVYVKETGVNMLAVAIGNAHGIYRERPRFDFERLEKLRDAAGVPLVLHGGSGTSPEDLSRAISLGIAKVNVASELIHAVRATLEGQWERGEGRWLPLALKGAMEALGVVVKKWIQMTGAAGRA